MNKKISRLLKNVALREIFGDDVLVRGISGDSRKVKNLNLFVAMAGLTVDGHDYIDQALKAGAIAIVGEKSPKKNWLKKATYVRVKDAKQALGMIASNWYDNPSKNLKIVGVTGTDGKTTTTNIIYHILNSSNKKVGLVSSISAKIGNKDYDTGLHVTNPEPIALQQFLAKMVEGGCKYAVIEVTSHGIDQKRITGVEFDTTVLTNITHEHLDYHKSFKNYFDTKVKFLRSAKKVIVLNKDDKTFDKIMSTGNKLPKVLSYAIDNPSADFVASDIGQDDLGTKFTISMHGTSLNVSTPLHGDYNVSNTLAAVSVAKQHRISSKSIIKALSNMYPLSGRLDEIENGMGFRIIIDFAHTPNSLENVLRLIKKQTKGKLIAVFGCAGERDIEKRKLMPKISVKYADISVFTAEDPRSESVDNILATMSKAASEKGTINVNTHQYRGPVDGIKHLYFLIPKRGEAIAFAIQKLARKGDSVVVCGKGHEKSMNYKGVEYAWSDHEAVKMALEGKVKKIKQK